MWTSLCRICDPVMLRDATDKSFTLWLQLMQQPNNLPFHQQMLLSKTNRLNVSKILFEFLKEFLDQIVYTKIVFN